MYSASKSSSRIENGSRRVSSKKRPGLNESKLTSWFVQGLALHDHALAVVAEPTRESHRGEHGHEGAMEHEVAGLAQVPALGRQRIPVALDAVAAAAQLRVRGSEGRLDIDHGLPLGVPHQPRQPGRRDRRAGAQGLEVVLGARNDAADERDKQQEVDGREPRRAVGVEDLQPVENREQIGVVALELHDAVGVSRTLRNERAGDRGDREQ